MPASDCVLPGEVQQHHDVPLREWQALLGSAMTGWRGRRVQVSIPAASWLEDCGVVNEVRIERIDVDRHDRSAFDCGDPAVDSWLRQAAVDADRRAAVVVQVAVVGSRVVGCYRLGSFQVQARTSATSPRHWSLERMPVPAVVVSRLGVDQGWQGRGFGGLLMWHALDLAAAVGPVVRARLVVACGVTEHPPGFLGRFGFRAFDTDPRWCYLLMQDIEATISAAAAPPHSPTVMDRPAPDR